MKRTIQKTLAMTILLYMLIIPLIIIPFPTSGGEMKNTMDKTIDNNTKELANEMITYAKKVILVSDSLMNDVVTIHKQHYDIVKESYEETTNNEIKEEITTPIIEENTSDAIVNEIPITKEEVLNESIQKDTYTEDEILLLRIASCEAGNQGVIGMAYVIKVVQNRIEDPSFANSVYGVIYEENQFSAINEHWWSDGYISDEAYEALELVNNGWDETEGALFFCTPSANEYHRSSLEYIKTYKDHEFYK